MTMTAPATVFDDRDLLDLLAGEPELLAIADALRETRRATAQDRRPRRRLAAAAAALAAAAAALLLVASPWQGSPSLAEQALAAVGTGPVVHVAIEHTGSPLWRLVDLRTGSEIPRTQRIEIWFDEERGLKRTVSSVDGQVLDEVLETPAGGWSRGGRVYTCAWIAAHPVEATKAGVSCNPSGENGRTPRTIPERAPTLEAALAGFVDGYRSALASGEAEEDGRAQVDGREVVWLRFASSGSGTRVAVDAASFEPVLLEWGSDAPLRVVAAEAVPRDVRVFTRPASVAAQTGGGIAAREAIEVAALHDVLPGTVWLGREWSGLSLVSAERQERMLRTGAGGAAGTMPVLKLTYARVGPDGVLDPSSTVDVYEAPGCLVSIGWTCSARDPASPDVLGAPFGQDGPLAIGQLRRDGLYVSIWKRSAAPDLLEIARALAPVPRGAG
jgi:hypothetical protein